MPKTMLRNKKMSRGQQKQYRAVQMYEAGADIQTIAQKMDITERYVRFLLQKERQAKEAIPAAVIPHDDLSPEAQACLEYSLAGFKLFYETYSRLPLMPHMQSWVSQALGAKRVLINCPPRHAKSKIFSVWFPLWLVTRNRDVQIIIASQTVDLAKKFTREIAEHMERNDKLIADFGRYLPTDDSAPWRPGMGELMVEGRKRQILPGDLTIQTRGAGQQILGMEAEWVILDDPVSRKHVSSVTEAEKLSEWFHGDVMTRLQPQGNVVVIGQRLGLNDLYGELADKRVAELEDTPLWTHLNSPAVLHFPTDEEPEPVVLWPEVWPFDELMKRKADVTRKGGVHLWNTMFQQDPLADSDVLVQREWIFGEPGCLDRNRILGQGIDAKDRKCRVLSLDPSPTMFAGLICADISIGQHMRLSMVDMVRDKMGVREMIQNIEAMNQRYGPIHYLIIETNAARFFMQGEDFQRWSRTSGVRILGHNTARNKQDPEWGVNSLARDFEFGMIRIPWSGPEAQRVFAPLIEEATSYPYGATDDLMMALWFIKYNWRRLPAVMTREIAPLRKPKGFHVPERLEKGYGWAKAAR